MIKKGCIFSVAVLLFSVALTQAEEPKKKEGNGIILMIPRVNLVQSGEEGVFHIKETPTPVFSNTEFAAERIEQGMSTHKKIIEYIPADIDKMIEYFKRIGLELDTIELWIQGAIESGGITRVIGSAKGETGIKVVIKPIKK